MPIANNPAINNPAVNYDFARSLPFSKSVINRLIALVDGLVVFVAGVAVYAVYLGWGHKNHELYISVSVIAAMATMITFYFTNLYDLRFIVHPENQYKKIVGFFGLIFLILIAMAFSLQITLHFSRVWAFTWFGVSIVSLCIWRVCCRTLLQNWARTGVLTKNIAILGGGEQGARLLQSLQDPKEPWIRIVGVFEDRRTRVSQSYGQYPVLGSMDDLIQYVREKRVDDVIVALPWTAEERLMGILDRLEILPVNVYLCSDLVGFNFLHHGYDYCSGVPVLNVHKRPLEGWNYVLKTVEDQVGAALFLLLCSPLLALIALLVKLDSPGPIFFRQNRLGFNNQIIQVLKFRTMYYDQQDNDATVLVTRNDPRVTRLGRILRRTSLDELPQFLNVLTGEMSLVGPRPHALKAAVAGKPYEDQVAKYAARHKVKPGITGWAQINGWRGETDTEEKIQKRVEHDLFYINHWSITFDIQIVLRTIWAIWFTETAY